MSRIYKTAMYITLSCIVVLTLSTIGSGKDIQRVTIGAHDLLITLLPSANVNDIPLLAQLNIYDPLVEASPQNEWVPALSTKWQWIDPLTWGFQLRERVKYQDGSSFSAEDVKATIDWMKQWPETQFKSEAQQIEKVEIVNDYYIKIRTFQVTPTLPALLGRLGIMSKSWLEKHGNDIPFMSLNANGTSSYKLVEFKPREYVKLEAYKECWRGNPEIKELIIKPITEDSTRVVALLSGDVDIITFCPLDFVERIKSSDRYKVVRDPQGQSMFLSVRQTKGFPTTDIRVRKALYMALDCDSMDKTMMYGMAPPTYINLGKGMTGWIPGKRLPFDVEKAKNLLKEAGYPNGFKITYSWAQGKHPKAQERAFAVAQMWNKIGVEVQLNPMMSNILYDSISKKQLECYELNWWQPTRDGYRFYSMLYGTPEKGPGWGTWNGQEYSNPKVDALLSEVAKEINLKKRKKLLEQVSQLLIDDVAYLPLFRSPVLYGARKGLEIETTFDNQIFGRRIHGTSE